MSDPRGRRPVTAIEAAAFLGVTAAAVRQMVRRHQIASVGHQGRAKLYWMHEITRKVGAHDRLLTSGDGSCMSHLTRSDRIP